MVVEITRIPSGNIYRQFFVVVTSTANTRCLVQNFQLICCSQRVNTMSQYTDSHTFKLYKVAKPPVGCSGETLLASRTRKKRL